MFLAKNMQINICLLKRVFRYGGGETEIINWCKNLTPMGLKFSLITGNNSLDPVTICKLAPFNNVIQTSNLSLFNRILFPVDPTLTLLSPRNFTFLASFTRIEKKFNPHIIHAFEHDAIISALLIGKMFSKPVVFTMSAALIPELMFSDYERFALWMFLERVGLNCADYVIVPTEKLKKYLISMYGLKDNLVVIPGGVGCNQFIPASKETRASLKQSLGLGRRKIIIFVGNMTWDQNEASVILMDKVAEALNNEEYLFIAVGDYDLSLLSRLKRVKLLGRVKDTLPYLQASEIGFAMFPANAYNLGQRKKVLEYMACGLPIITTKTGIDALPDFVDGKHGYIVESAAEAASVLTELIGNKPIYDRLSSQCRELALKYDSNINAKAHAFLYRDLIER